MRLEASTNTGLGYLSEGDKFYFSGSASKRAYTVTQKYLGKTIAASFVEYRSEQGTVYQSGDFGKKVTVLVSSNSNPFLKRLSKRFGEASDKSAPLTLEMILNATEGMEISEQAKVLQAYFKKLKT
jgi:hypothetical protein